MVGFKMYLLKQILRISKLRSAATSASHPEFVSHPAPVYACLKYIYIYLRYIPIGWQIRKISS